LAFTAFGEIISTTGTKMSIILFSSLLQYQLAVIND